VKSSVSMISGLICPNCFNKDLAEYKRQTKKKEENMVNLGLFYHFIP
jgi:hypothetical protein